MGRAMQRQDRLPRLWKHEALGVGVQRVLLQCLAVAAAAVPEDVHRARLALKRARAVLRLGQTCGLAWTRLVRRQLARHARRLAAVRDQAVVAKMAGAWAAEFHGEARRCALAVAEEAAAQRSVVRWHEWSRWLVGKRKRLEGRAWSALNRRKVSRALTKAVRRARKRRREASGGAGAGELHEWRKAVIVLREQLYVLDPLLTPVQRRLPVRLHGIARTLGTVGDWLMMIDAICGTRRRRGVKGGQERLINRAQAARRAAIRQARREWAALQPKLRGRLA